jgi:type I restriction-modification system DNA methylase subunit
MSIAKKMSNISKDYRSAIRGLFDELEGRILDRSKLILVLCAAICKHRDAEKFSGRPEDVHQYVSRITAQGPAEFRSSLSQVMDLTPGSLVQIVKTLELVAGSKQGLDTLWDMALQEERQGGDLNRFLSPVVALFCTKIAGPRKSDHALCPYIASFDFARHVLDTGAHVTIRAQHNLLAGLLLKELFHGPVVIEQENPFERGFSEEPSPSDFDVILASPPISTKYESVLTDRQLAGFKFKTRHVEGLAIQHAMHLAKRKAVVLVAPGFTFRTTADERELKRYIVDSGKLEAVVRLPSGSFANSNISAIALVLGGKDSSPVSQTLFVNASNLDIKTGDPRAVTAIAEMVSSRMEGEISRLVDAAEIADNQYNIEPGRYILDDRRQRLASYLSSSKHVALGDVVEILRPQVITSDTDTGRAVKEVGFSDIQGDGIVVQPTREKMLSSDAAKRLERFFLKRGDILLSVKGTVGRVALVEDTAGETWIPSQSFVILRLDPRESRVSPQYLFYFLASWGGQEQIESAKAGTVVSIISAQDIRELRVVLPTLKTQNKVAETHAKIIALRKEIGEAERKIEEMRTEILSVEKASGKVGG